MEKRKIAAVICEYDPFHAGHASLFERLREAEGEETAIVAIMSGNYTQRGEAAFFPKGVRAECAIRGGADLVLELPFPYSSAGAERFANAGVHIAESLGGVDVLFFGSESGNIEELTQLAERLEAPAFLDAFYAASERNGVGCAQKTQAVYRQVYGERDTLLPLLRQPNNVLGVEYIRALSRKKSKIRPLTFRRGGMSHGETELQGKAPITSASAARLGLLQKDAREEIFNRLPPAVADVLRKAAARGDILADEGRLLSYCLMHVRNVEKDTLLLSDGMKGGLGDRIIRAAWEADTPEAFFAALRSKKHTDAYLRRALLYALFGITREQLNAPPAYTQILAMNERGQKVLAYARKHATIPLLTRPSGIHRFSAEKKNSLRADSVYCALLERASRPCDILRYRPYRENR